MDHQFRLGDQVKSTASGQVRRYHNVIRCQADSPTGGDSRIDVDRLRRGRQAATAQVGGISQESERVRAALAVYDQVRREAGVQTLNLEYISATPGVDGQAACGVREGDDFGEVRVNSGFSDGGCNIVGKGNRLYVAIESENTVGGDQAVCDGFQAGVAERRAVYVHFAIIITGEGV